MQKHHYAIVSDAGLGDTDCYDNIAVSESQNPHSACFAEQAGKSELSGSVTDMPSSLAPPIDETNRLQSQVSWNTMGLHTQADIFDRTSSAIYEESKTSMAANLF